MKSIGPVLNLNQRPQATKMRHFYRSFSYKIFAATLIAPAI